MLLNVDDSLCESEIGGTVMWGRHSCLPGRQECLPHGIRSVPATLEILMLLELRRLFGCIAVLLSAAATHAAEIHLKAQAVVPGQTVCLADVAEIHAGS